MSTVNTGYANSYATYGSAYARAAATAPPSLANALDANEQSSSNAATNLTLSDAARARMAGTATKDFSTVTSDARSALDALYTAAKVKGPIGDDGQPTVDLGSLDRRELFAMVTNNGGKFSVDEQTVAYAELTNRMNAALAPGANTAKLTGDFSSIYKAAADYLDGASPEEKATPGWQAQRDAITKGMQATTKDPGKAPTGIANDPVAAYLAQDADAVTPPLQDFSSVAKSARAALDAQKAAAVAAGKVLFFDPGRKVGQLADLSGLDNRALSAMALNQDGLFAVDESYAAKKELDSRSRTTVLEALKQSQSSGDPTKFSLGILNAYSAMSDEERLATNWTPAFRDNAVQSYKSTNSILSLLKSS
jgi:hypothetical protein